MKTSRDRKQKVSAAGFSLIELLVVVAMISLVLIPILVQVDQVQQRSVAEQDKMSDFEQARDFLAQLSRDARQMGYPNVHNFDTTAGTWQSPLINDSRLAVGLIKLTSSEMDFGGDVNQSGSVSVLSYKINGDSLCATCMERAQVAKTNGNPLTQVTNIAATSYIQEVQNVKNATSTTAPIFSAYDASGTQITLPVDITSDPTDTARVRLIKLNLSVANPASVDPRTGTQLEADISGDVQVVNCSMATTQATLQAAGISFPGYVQLTCQ